MATSDARSSYEHLIEHIQDAVIRFDLADGEPIIRDANAAFEAVFGYDREDVENAPLNDLIVPEWLSSEARGLDASTAAGEINYRRVRRETVNGLREFLYRGIPTDEGGFAVYTDLTDISRTERRLQVMNRVMRHNLRNKATVILAHTARLLDAVDEPGEHVQSVVDVEHAAAELERLAREAAEFESILNAPLSSDASFDAVPEIHATVTDFAERYPAARIEVETPDRLLVKGDGHMRLAIEALVENAITHHDAPDPTVVIGGERLAAGWASLTIADDGPRIPRADREVVGGAAEISPTRHGTGLGLWLVKWCTERVGGELLFEESEMGGNRVRLRLPDGSSTDQSSSS